MEEQLKTWYEKNSQEIKLIQFIIYHLKKSGHIIKTRKGTTIQDVSKIEIEHGDIILKYD